MESVLNEESWDEAKIEKRAYWLYEKAKNLWNAVLPAVAEESEPQVETQLQSLIQIRKQYWKHALPIIQEKTVDRGAFANVSPHTGYELFGFTGIPGVRIVCGVNEKIAYVYLSLCSSDKDKNKSDFDTLIAHKEEIIIT